ncbi:MAG TPA: nuclear transport factor 2 family protein [Terracidiphilus sp.]|nr:nuclear transport factor 2 family protein [Terracidiphilus sp.]
MRVKTFLFFLPGVFLLLCAPSYGRAQMGTSTANPTVQETRVRSAWAAFRNKDKKAFAAMLADGFSEVEEDGAGFGDKAAILAMIDHFELTAYTLTDFKVTTIAKGAALVTYNAQYEGKFEGQPMHAKTAYGEIWVKRDHTWKLLYVQETNVK